MGYDHMSVEVQSEMVCSGKQCSGAAQHSAQGTRSKHEDDGCLVPWLGVLPDYFSNLPEGTIKECSTMERSFLQFGPAPYLDRPLASHLELFQGWYKLVV